MTTLRLAILSAARISGVIASASSQVPEVKIVAVASRTASKAADFAARYHIPTTCTYGELIESSEVDAIYIPLPTALATQWAIRAAKAGKHILVDKPFENAAAVRSIIDVARQAGVVFLDGTHFVHSMRSREVLQKVKDMCGELRIVKASFSAPMNLAGDIRTDTSLEPQGSLGDLGWYCCRAAVFFLGAEKTRSVKRAVCLGNVTKTGVVYDASGVVEFDKGARLSMDVSFDTVLRQRVEVAGTLGCVRIDDFVMPNCIWNNPGVAATEYVETEYKTDTGMWMSDSPLGAKFPSVSKTDDIKVNEGKRAVQVVHMLRQFLSLIEEKKKGDESGVSRWEAEALNTQQAVDALHEQCLKSCE